MPYSAETIAQINAYNADLKAAQNGDSSYAIMDGDAIFDINGNLEALYIGKHDVTIPVDRIHPWMVEVIQEEGDACDCHAEELYFEDVLVRF